MEITTPSGLRGEFRKLKGHETNALADRKAAAKGLTFDRVLSGIWTKTTDPGPYQRLKVEVGEGPVPWGKILVCDRFYVLALARIATYGPEFVFKLKCQDQTCDKAFSWEINLETDVRVLDLPEKSREKIAVGDNRFETAIEGRAIAFKLMTGDDERNTGLRAEESASELMTLALSSRIIEVEGLNRGQIEAWINELDAPVQFDLLDKFEAVDGGFDNRIEVECPRCFQVFEVPVPFAGAAFWTPRSLSTKNRLRGNERQGRSIADRNKGAEPKEE